MPVSIIPSVIGYWMWDQAELSVISCIVEAHTVNSKLSRSASAGLKTTVCRFPSLISALRGQCLPDCFYCSVFSACGSFSKKRKKNALNLVFLKHNIKVDELQQISELHPHMYKEMCLRACGEKVVPK